MPIKLRRKRYAAIVVSLLTLVFVGVGAVVSMMTLTTFRPLPFVEPNQLVQYVEIEDGDPELWESDSLAQTSRLVPEIVGSAMYTSTMPMPLTFGALEKPARVIVTSPNFLSALGLRVDRPSAATVYANTPGTAIISRSFARSLGLTPESAPGQQIRVEGRSLTVAGTFDRESAFPADGDVWYADPGRRGTNGCIQRPSRGRRPPVLDGRLLSAMSPCVWPRPIPCGRERRQPATDPQGLPRLRANQTGRSLCARRALRRWSARDVQDVQG